MPACASMKVMTSPDSQGVTLVPLANGLYVPDSFGFATTVQLDGRDIAVRGGVAMVDGRPRLDGVACRPPLSPNEMRRVVTNALLDGAVAKAAVTYTPVDDDFLFGEAYQNLVTRGLDGAALDAAQRARYRRTTPEHLRDVLAIHATSGVTGVMEKFNYTERHARRLLARAKKEKDK